MTIKSKDLAKLLGVCPATVSLLINNKPGISDSLREKLTKQIIELGYGDMLKTNTAAQASENSPYPQSATPSSMRFIRSMISEQTNQVFMLTSSRAVKFRHESSALIFKSFISTRSAAVASRDA